MVSTDWIVVDGIKFIIMGQLMIQCYWNGIKKLYWGNKISISTNFIISGETATN